MKFINSILFILIFSILCINQNAHASIPVIGEREIIRVNENMFIGKKKLPYRNMNGSVNAEGDDVYFVLQKLTPENYRFWAEYLTEQERATRNRDAIADLNDGSGNKKSVTINDGTSSFKKSLELRLELRSDIWIAYATRKNPTPVPDPGYRDDISWDESEWPADRHEEFSEYLRMQNLFRASRISGSDIEMTFSVFLNAEAPITTHMGIFRNYEYFLNKERPHIGLSMELHAFSAKASQNIYGPKEYMVTSPAIEMRNIMLRSFQKVGLDNFIWVGDTEGREKHKKGDITGLAERDFLYPADLTVPPPFDNRDPQNWAITSSDGAVIRFQRPDWFGEMKKSEERNKVGEIIETVRRKGGHGHLLNHLPTAIIPLEALTALWEDY